MAHFTTTGRLCRLLTCLGIATISIHSLYGQQGASEYPYIDPTARASGMTIGMENGATGQSINMMQVRAAAHDAERAAAAAAMARSANEAIEEQQLSRALEKARETRRQKMAASEQLKWKKATAYNAYNKVSSGQMSSWKDDQGNIKIGRGLPSDFVSSVRNQQQKAQQAAASTAEKANNGFKPLKKIGEKIADNDPYQQTGLRGPQPLPQTTVPAQQTIANSDPEEMKAGRRLMQKLTPPKLKGPKLSFPKLGKKPTDVPQFTQGPAAPAAVQTAANTAVAAATAQTTAQAAPPATAISAANSAAPAVIKTSRSAAAMLGEAGQQATNAADSAIANATQSADTAVQKKTGGLFALGGRKISANSPTAAPPGPQNKLFGGLGKKKSSSVDTSAPVSSGLFPSAPAPTGPTPGQPVAMNTSTVPAPTNTQPQTSSTMAMPGTTPPPATKKKFSFPTPKIANKSNGSTGKSLGSRGVSATTTVNQHGNNYYVVESNSQFIKYGDNETSTSISAVGPGTIVMMTKPGANYATVQLPNGATGNIETKHLRAASGTDVSALSGSR